MQSPDPKQSLRRLDTPSQGPVHLLVTWIHNISLVTHKLEP